MGIGKGIGLGLAVAVRSREVRRHEDIAHLPLALTI